MMRKSLKDYGQYADTNRISAWGSILPLGDDNKPLLGLDSAFLGVIKEHEAVSSTAQPILVYDRRISEIEKEVKALKEMIAEMNRPFGSEESVTIALRDIPRDQAKNEIKEYFEAHHGENLYSHNITEALCIDLEMVDDVLGEMEKEGQIKEVSANG
jgi:hypothetical protein